MFPLIFTRPRLIRALTLLSALFCLALPAAHATTEIVAYGDSGVAGKGLSPSQAYPAQLQRMLRQKGYDVSVVNRGVNGRTSADALANLDSEVSSSAKVVIVQFGVNDIKHAIPAEQVRRNIEEMVSRLRNRGVGVLIVGYPQVDNLSMIASAHGALYVRWGGLPDSKFHVPNDPNNHFNAAGLEVMASRMLPAVEKLLRSNANG